jgi:uncharacterized integral membrane protein (TIGR00697 family)
MQKRNYKYLGYITGLYITFQVANLIIPGKIIGLWGIAVPATVLFFPITYVFADVITEVYGYAQSRKVIWQVFFATLVGALMFLITAYLPPAQGFLHNAAYKKVLSFAPRVFVASLIANWVGAFLNDYILAKMKIWSKGRQLWMRTIGSTILGEGLNTIIFYTLAFIGVLSSSLLLKAIIWGWIIKTLVEVVMTPVTYYVVRKLKKAEEEDYYDNNTDFNPFIIS